MKIIGFHGAKQSGKDTSCSHLATLTTVKRFAYGDELKKECYKKFGMSLELMHGTDEDKNTPEPYIWREQDGKIYHEDQLPCVMSSDLERLTIRTFLQYYGTEVMRSINDKCWINVVETLVKDYALLNPDHLIVITDARFQGEINHVRGMGGTVVALTRCVAKSKHSSEPTPTPDKVDVFIDNAVLPVDEANALLVDSLRKLDII